MSDTFKQEKHFGDHFIYSYHPDRYGIREMIEEMYGTSVEILQTTSVDFQTREKGTLQDIETDLHKIFYTNIKSSDRFKKVYCRIIRDIFDQFFPDDKVMIYQSFPSIRFQFPGNTCVPPHYDSDSIGKHPVGERNFLLPITKMTGTARLFIESTPGANDAQGVDLEYGQILYFNGNKCMHHNVTNTEDYMRISFDFRVIRLSDYMNYMKQDITLTNPRDPEQTRKPVRMTIGGYYQCMFREDTEDDVLEWYAQKDMVLQTRPCFDNTEPDACLAYFKNGDPFLTEYTETQALEKELAAYIGVSHCAMTPSGTSAIIIALLAGGIQPGDDVIVPNYTMVATANAVRVLGANPVLVDVNPETYTLDLETIRSHRTQRTKAVVHVSLNNRSIGIEEIARYCKQEGLFFIEDSAQSLGCRHNGVHYGTFGDIGCFSLSSPKIITTGQGGFLVTNNTSLYKKIQSLKNFGRQQSGGEVYDSFGLNMKFTDIQAAIGRAQLLKLPERVIRMRTLFDTYYRGIRGLTHIQMLPPRDDEWIPWFVDIECKARSTLISFLSKHNVQTRVTYPSIHSLHTYNQTGEFPASQHISTNGLFLPTHFLITDAQIRYICRLLHVFDLSCA
jgi:perosamine synthetase